MIPPSVPVIELIGLEARRGSIRVLADIDLAVEAGSAVGVVGPNGSGKTTLLRVIATLLSPSGGTGRVLGTPLGSDRHHSIRPRIEMLGHTPALYADLTLQENLSFAARLTGQPDMRVAEVLDAVGLARVADLRASRASWGMQRRVEFARILLTSPELVLLDEPFAGLDPDAAAMVAAVVTGARRRGGAAVLASHEAQPLEVLTDRIYSLQGGSLSELERAGL